MCWGNTSYESSNRLDHFLKTFSVSEFNSGFLKIKVANKDSNAAVLTFCCYLYWLFLLHLWFAYDLNDFLEIAVSLCLLPLLWNPTNVGTCMLQIFSPEIYIFIPEAADERCSAKKVFLETSQNFSFLIKLQAWDSGTGVFLWILRNF